LAVSYTEDRHCGPEKVYREIQFTHVLRFSPKSYFCQTIEFVFRNMKKRNEDNQNIRENNSEELSAEALGFINRLLEQLHQADFTNQGSKIQIVYVASGGQHMDHVDNQYFYGDTCSKSTKTSKEKDESDTKTFDDETPLSALFRENHHEELRKVIESWRPYLIGDNTTVDALAMTRFEFDKERIYSNKVYRDLCELDALGALHVSLSQLAHYLADHSNLSRSYATLYQQLKNYRSEYVTYSP